MYATSIDPLTTVYIVLEVVIALIVILGNTIVCYVVLHSSVLRRKIMYMFVTSLAMADLSVGLIVIPLAILTKVGLPYNSPKLCIVMLSFIVAPTQISIFNLMAISIERYLAIRHPRIHYSKLTTKRACTIIICTWIVSILIGLLPVLGWNDIQEFFLDYTSEHITQEFDNENATTVVTSSIGITDGWNTSTTIPPTGSTALPCIFIEVMDENYLFFNFATCVLPPLVTSAILYFIIFLRLKKTNSPFPSPLLDLKKPKNNKTNENSPCLKRFPLLGILILIAVFLFTVYTYNEINQSINQSIKLKVNSAQLLRSNGNRRDEIMDHTKSNHQASLPVPHEKVSKSKEKAKIANGEGVKESQDGSGLPSANNMIQHADSVAKLNQEHGIDEKLLRAKLNILAKKGRCGNDACPSHNGSKFTKECNTGLSGSAGSSHLSTPQLMRSRTGTDLSLATKRRIHEARHHKRTKEIRAAAVLGLIVLSFAICWLPVHILNTIARFSNTVIPPFAYDITILLSHVNSAVNFILYSWRLKAFRDQLHKVFKTVDLFSCVNEN